MVSFISDALAAAPALEAGASSAQGGLASFLPFILVLAVFYFLLIRPQQRRAKEHQGMVSALKKGDRVVTGGGILGTITKADAETMLHLQIAEGVIIEVLRSSILSVVADVSDSPAQKTKTKAAIKQVANDN
ncbi:MAG: preprotein translocase subunit YajC [Rickettsiales bacterium]|nr:preprotein translocase subunit YajC [Rickettsiales bacterium]